MIVIPFVGNLSDKIGRRPCMIVGSLGSAVLAYPYLYFVAEDNFCDGVPVRHADVGRGLPGLQRGVPGLLPGAVPDQDTRVTAFAISQNPGTLVTAFLPAIYSALAGPTPAACVAEQGVPARRGASLRPDLRGGGRGGSRWTWSGRSAPSRWRSAILAAVVAYFTQETYRIHMNDLGNPNAVPVPLEEYHRIRTTGVDEPVH